MTDWQVSVWFYICIVNHLLQSINSLLAGCLTMFIVCTFLYETKYMVICLGIRTQDEVTV